MFHYSLALPKADALTLESLLAHFASCRTAPATRTLLACTSLSFLFPVGALIEMAGRVSGAEGSFPFSITQPQMRFVAPSTNQERTC